MKKVFFCLFLFVFTLTGCSTSNLQSMNYNELQEKMHNKESFIIYFSQNESELEKKLSKVLDESNLTGYKIDTNKISSEEKNKLEVEIAYEDPSIVFIINGKDPSKLSHITDENITSKEIIQRLKDINFIK